MRPSCVPTRIALERLGAAAGQLKRLQRPIDHLAQDLGLERHIVVHALHAVDVPREFGNEILLRLVRGFAVRVTTPSRVSVLVLSALVERCEASASLVRHVSALHFEAIDRFGSSPG